MFSQLYHKLRQQGVKFYLTSLYPVILNRRARAIGKKDKIEVVFFAFNVAMWRYQGVYDLLSKDKRFNCHVVFTVPRTFTDEQKASDLQQMRSYFGSLGISYVDYDESDPAGFNVREQINPDILFYPQPYDYMYPANHDFFLFKDKLLCYIPYAVNVIKEQHNLYDLIYQNLAWKVYCPLHYEKEKAKITARNHGRNWIVSGYANLDRYLSDEVNDVWKIKDRSIKRLIWAPHFTIAKELSWLEARSNFLWMSRLMLDVAERYKDRLQIAFKPHPRLKSELYHHPEWGKEKTDRYYEQWSTMDNTQLETGDFVDLFKSSDAMIHDCGSFTAEYLFVNKPVAFTVSDLASLKEDHSDFGRMALDQHYIVGNEEEVLSFIEDVVLGGSDTMAQQRTAFFETVLRPNVNGKTSQFIVEDIKKSLGMT